MMNFRSFLAPLLAVAALPAVASSLRGETGGPAVAHLLPVIELFTSQGCSSCPPADALLESYTKRSDVVALSFPVDYWDYLGWKDTLASPRFSARQRAYAKARGDGAVYTPQVVVNGLAHGVGSRRSDIDQAIEATGKTIKPLLVPLKVSSSNGRLTVEAGAAQAGATIKEATLWLAVIDPKVEVTIQRGENRGSTVTYHNVVRELTPIGMWSGAPLTVTLENHALGRTGNQACAVLLQQGPAGPIVAAAMVGGTP